MLSVESCVLDIGWEMEADKGLNKYLLVKHYFQF